MLIRVIVVDHEFAANVSRKTCSVILKWFMALRNK